MIDIERLTDAELDDLQDELWMRRDQLYELEKEFELAELGQSLDAS